MANSEPQPGPGHGTRAAGLVPTFRGLPVVGRWASAGAASMGVLGAVVGLVVGLLAYPPTAWFAVIELGLPAGAVGAGLGALGGLAVLAGRRLRR
jgi:hypothetical protein